MPTFTRLKLKKLNGKIESEGKENMNLYEIDYYDKYSGEKKTATATGIGSYETVKDFVFRRKGNVLITDIRFVCSYDELFDRKRG